jgi:hypothetical protein
MHSVLVKVKLSDNPNPTILREQVVPRVKALPGFMAGYWARGALVPSMVPSGTTIEGNEMSEVVAHA